MKNLNESLLESIDLIQESTLESELDVIFAIGNQYAKVGLITEYADEEVVNEFGVIQESVFFQERATAPAGNAKAATTGGGESIGSKIWGGIKKFFSMIGHAIKSAWDWIVGKAQKLGNWVKSWFQKKDKKGAKSTTSDASAKIDSAAEAVKAAETEEAAKAAMTKAFEATEAASAELEEYGKEIKAQNDAAEFSKVEKASAELEEYGKLIDQMKNDPELKNNTAAVLRKVYDMLNKMDVRLNDVVGKSSNAVARSTGEVDKDFDLLLSIAKKIYGRKVHKDKDLAKSFEALQKQKLWKNFDIKNLFEYHYTSKSDKYTTYLQNYEAVYEFTFLERLADLPRKLNSGKLDVKKMNSNIDSLMKTRVYYFDISNDTDTPVTAAEAQKNSIHQAIRECENFTSNSTNITDTPKELESVAKRLENELMPYITHGTAEMLAYQRYISDVFAEFKKQVTA